MIIGLSGVARSGKDTVADRLVAEHGFTKIGFADSLKQALYALDPIIDSGDHGELIGYAEAVDRMGLDDAKDAYPEVRRLLQRLGTEVGREQWSEDFWVDRLHDTIEALPLGTNVVIPDCRFPNEADFVQSTMGGQVWRIHRPGFAPVNPHSSETALDDHDFDQHLTNDKTIAALHEHVDYLVEVLL